VTAATGRRIGPAGAVPAGEGRAFEVDGRQVAVFRLRDGSLRATDATCPHAGGPLADGQIDMRKVVCPLHLRAYSFTDGSCTEGPSVAVYGISEEAGELLLDL
jgi:nitrite reductase (NADH) small subunit